MVDNNQSIQFYMKEHFNIKEFSATCTGPGNVLNRLFNSIVNRINENVLLPKFMVMVIDGDIIHDIKSEGFGITRVLSVAIDYLLKSIHRLIFAHKEILSQKSKKFNYLTIIWITPPTHRHFSDNSYRAKFVKHLEKAIFLYKEMKFLKLKSWDFEDNVLVVETTNSYRFTSKGLSRYWITVDSAIQFWDEKRPMDLHQRNNYQVVQAELESRRIGNLAAKNGTSVVDYQYLSHNLFHLACSIHTPLSC